MLTRIILAIVVACIVGIVLYIVGAILATIGIPIAETVGRLLQQFSWAIGVLAGLWFFFTGRTTLAL